MKMTLKKFCVRPLSESWESVGNVLFPASDMRNISVISGKQLSCFLNSLSEIPSSRCLAATGIKTREPRLPLTTREHSSVLQSNQYLRTTK